MTPSQLKQLHLKHDPESYYFTRDTMSFFGDTMANYRVITHESFYELARKRPVKDGNQSSSYFSKDTGETLVRD